MEKGIESPASSRAAWPLLMETHGISWDLDSPTFHLKAVASQLLRQRIPVGQMDQEN